jgi:hypothetical protein
MKRKRTAKNENETAKAQKAQRNDEVCQEVLNANGERVRGLWTRFGVYYAQPDANDGGQYRYRLEHAETVPQAVLAQQARKIQQKVGQLLPPAEQFGISCPAEAEFLGGRTQPGPTPARSRPWRQSGWAGRRSGR